MRGHVSLGFWDSGPPMPMPSALKPSHAGGTRWDGVADGRFGGGRLEFGRDMRLEASDAAAMDFSRVSRDEIRETRRKAHGIGAISAPAPDGSDEGPVASPGSFAEAAFAATAAKRRLRMTASREERAVSAISAAPLFP